MSLLDFGADQVTEEQQQFKNKLSDRDALIAAQQNDILKQNALIEDIKSSLHDAIHKLNQETDRAMRLERESSRHAEDLRREQLVSKNHEASISSANEKLKAKDLEIRELQAALDSLSHQSDANSTFGAKLAKEKGVLEARVRELEMNLRLLSSPPSAETSERQPKTTATPARNRSSSLSNFRITTLETELSDLRATLAQRDADLRLKEQKLSTLQQEMVNADNERMAQEKRSARDLVELRQRLEEKDEELEYLQQCQGGEREEELLRRIDEDEAKIATLEAMVQSAENVQGLKNKLRWTEAKLETQSSHLAASNARIDDLVKVQEKSAEDLASARANISSLSQLLSEKETRIRKLEGADSASCSTQDIGHVERLLSAIQRLRTERDGLRRDVEFLQSELQFTVEALEAKITSLSYATEDVQTLRLELDHAQEAAKAQGQRVDQLSLALVASSIVIQHVSGEAASEPAEPLDQGGHDQTVSEMRARLEITMQCLEETTDQRNDLMSQLDLAERERNEEVGEMRCELERVDDKLNELTKALENVESERDSLKLQVANLNTDLQLAQNDLAEAESRYSSLQFHQLSNMTDNEATRVLKGQIQELEMRVMRRTEQIGIHQHDIRRMETNLRLQEERLMEMTVEMETLATQKEAMVEDCADAREARDEALAKVDRMELEVEHVEGRLGESESALETMIQLMVQTLDDHRRSIAAHKMHNERVEGELDSLSAKHTKVVGLLQAKTTECEMLELRAEEAGVDARQTAVALAVSQLELKETGRTDLQTQLARLQERYEAQYTETRSLMAQLERLQNDKRKEVSELEAKVSELDQHIVNLQKEHESAVLVLRCQLEDRATGVHDSANELVQLKVKHIDELGAVQSRLVETVSALEEAQARYNALETTYQQSLVDWDHTQQEFEERLKVASEAARVQKECEDSHLRVEEEQTLLLASLRERLASADAEQLKVQQSLEDAKHTLDESQRRQQLELEQKQTQIQQLSSELMHSRQLLTSESQRVAEREEQIGKLEDQLRTQLELQDEERSSHEHAIQQSNSILASMKEELGNIQGELDDRLREVEILQGERMTLQQDMTVLEAEHQRSLSLIRHLERQVQDAESRTRSLSGELEHAQERLVQAERSASSAEVNLNLLGAQHKREMAQLQRELEALKAKPNLESALNSLEERNSEMEELLKEKCREIEENDDRVLEILKDNKKLTSKVDVLNRKVQSLQAKLDVVKTSGSKTSPQSSDSPALGRALLAAPTSRPRSNTFASPAAPVVATSRERIASGPSSLPRPKTPDRKTPFFQPPSPDKRILSSPFSSKKRPAPEEFPVLPAKGFTPECVPQKDEGEQGTPRARRALHSSHSGFTPTRQHRPINPLPSRPDVRPTSFMADVTNQAHAIPPDYAEKPSKRGWLTKIRGGSAATTISRVVQ